VTEKTKSAGELALDALRLHDDYQDMPVDRGGPTGPRAKAYDVWIAAKNAALVAEARETRSAPPKTEASKSTFGDAWHLGVIRLRCISLMREVLSRVSGPGDLRDKVDAALTEAFSQLGPEIDAKPLFYVSAEHLSEMQDVMRALDGRVPVSLNASGRFSVPVYVAPPASISAREAFVLLRACLLTETIDPTEPLIHAFDRCVEQTLKG
jgi:hypothetical protein